MLLTKGCSHAATDGVVAITANPDGGQITRTERSEADQFPQVSMPPTGTSGKDLRSGRGGHRNATTSPFSVSIIPPSSGLLMPHLVRIIFIT